MSEAIMSYPTLLLIWIGLICVGYLVDYVYGGLRSCGSAPEEG